MTMGFYSRRLGGPDYLGDSVDKAIDSMTGAEVSRVAYDYLTRTYRNDLDALATMLSRDAIPNARGIVRLALEEIEACGPSRDRDAGIRHVAYGSVYWGSAPCRSSNRKTTSNNRPKARARRPAKAVNARRRCA